MVSDNIRQFLNSWKNGVIEIGKVFVDGGDYKKCAENFLSAHYAFDIEEVLFKPTFTKEVIFRHKKDDALSYFVKGGIEEDNGFALSNWSEILFDNSNIIVNENIGIAMGNYTFKNETSNIKVEYSFVYKKYGDEIKVILHHSSLPYKT